jgi:hypothetical protein
VPARDIAAQREARLAAREHIIEPGNIVFRHACKRCSHAWLKMKNPNAPAVKREADED